MVNLDIAHVLDSHNVHIIILKHRQSTTMQNVKCYGWSENTSQHFDWRMKMLEPPQNSLRPGPNVQFRFVWIERLCKNILHLP